MFDGMESVVERGEAASRLEQERDAWRRLALALQEERTNRCGRVLDDQRRARNALRALGIDPANGGRARPCRTNLDAALAAAEHQRRAAVAVGHASRWRPPKRELVSTSIWHVAGACIAASLACRARCATAAGTSTIISAGGPMAYDHANSAGL